NVMPVYVSTGFCGLIESCEVFPPAPLAVTNVPTVPPVPVVVVSEPELCPPTPKLELLCEALHPPAIAASALEAVVIAKRKRTERVDKAMIASLGRSDLSRIEAVRSLLRRRRLRAVVVDALVALHHAAAVRVRGARLELHRAAHRGRNANLLHATVDVDLAA